MPTPKENEPKEKFMKRCIPMLVNEGKEPKQAIAICFSIYDRKDEGASTTANLAPYTSKLGLDSDEILPVKKKE